MIWNDDNTIRLEELTKKPRKLTGTRLGGVLGLNKWNDPFKEWCIITHTWEEPYESDEYTILGKVIEDLQCKYLGSTYFYKVVKPEDIYGRDFFKTTHGDFYPKEKVFGGMWDALVYDGDNPVAVVECKTTMRAEDWVSEKGEVQVPIYYALQGSLYAYLLGLDDVYIIVSFPSYEDYTKVRNVISEKGISVADQMVEDGSMAKLVDYKPSSKNTSIIHFKVSEQFTNFEQLLAEATKWYDEHVRKGLSPQYDEEKDGIILRDLRTKHLNPTTDINELFSRYEQLDDELNQLSDEFEEKEDELENIKDQIKEYMSRELSEKDNINQVVGETETSRFICKRIPVPRFDSKKLQKEDPDTYQKYLITTNRTTLSRLLKKESK